MNQRKEHRVEWGPRVTQVEDIVTMQTLRGMQQARRRRIFSGSRFVKMQGVNVKHRRLQGGSVWCGAEEQGHITSGINIGVHHESLGSWRGDQRLAARSRKGKGVLGWWEGRG